MLVDSHCHLYAFERPENFRDIYILVVAEDYSTSLESIRLANSMENVFASVGIHPWNLHKAGRDDLDNAFKLAKDDVVKCIGEVGLDRRYAKAPFDKQLEVFESFAKISKECSLPMNVHCLDAWRVTLDVALRIDVPKVLFHWYTGPDDVLDSICSVGYFVSINPSARIQPKHREVARRAEIGCILSESDGPYNYRGIFLEPSMVKDVIRLIAELKGMDEEAVSSRVYDNFRSFLKV